MKIVANFELGQLNGVESFTGTSSEQIDKVNRRKIADFDNQFFYGQFANVSNVDCKVTLQFAKRSIPLKTHQLRRKEVLTLRGVPLRNMSVVIDGTTTLKGQGVIVEAEDDEERKQLLDKAIMEESFNELEAAAGLTFPTYDNSSIAAATTTTVATPAAGKSIRVYKITVAVEAANNVTLFWTDSDGISNPNQIGKLVFGGAGVFVYDFGDRGLLIPNGADGLLRATISTAAQTDIDIISEDVDP